MSEIADNTTRLAMLVDQAINKTKTAVKEPEEAPPVIKSDKIIFLSGKMTGIKNYNKPYFDHWERFFRAQGRKVLNPACLPLDLPQKVYIPITLAMLEQCDEIFMIPGWTDSPGANIERNYAIKTEKDITYESDYAKAYDGWVTKADLLSAVQWENEF